MTIAERILPEFDHEMASTRRMLAAVPDADAAWRPHPKSYTLGDLAAHLANLPRWCRLTLELSELDLGAPANASLARIPFTSTPALLERFDRNVGEARAALAPASDAAMQEPWSLKNGATTVFTLPRVGVVRAFILSHMIHHRGQLSVYLRLRDVPVPGTYGPSADGP